MCPHATVRKRNLNRNQTNTRKYVYRCLLLSFLSRFLSSKYIVALSNSLELRLVKRCEELFIPWFCNKICCSLFADVDVDELLSSWFLLNCMTLVHIVFSFSVSAANTSFSLFVNKVKDNWDVVDLLLFADDAGDEDPDLLLFVDVACGE